MSSPRPRRFQQPTLVVLHWTGGRDLPAETVATLMFRRRLSAHLIIDTAGGVVQPVPFSRCAWHAGKSVWKGVSGVNRFSVGIELVNPGWKRVNYTEWPYGWAYVGDKMYARFSDVQLAELAECLDDIRALYGANIEVVGHKDVSPGRKSDPGPLLSEFMT